MLSAKNCLTELYDISKIQKLNFERTKAFRKSIHKHVGNYFWCCEFHCEMQIDTEQKKKEYQTLRENLKRVNRHYYKLKNNGV